MAIATDSPAHAVPGASPSGQAHAILCVRCAHCDAAVVIECEGLQGFWGYQTYNEYFCPQCRKQNHERTPGAVVSARMATDADGKAAVSRAKTTVSP